ncbi:zinc finger protein 507 [Eucyclogobius newberryi]|uniref:zinc finger protein 507 n=1 Tax=Eucyclogobius newberryi TaxID=166745 RepID=UPI003B58D10E
MEEVSDTAVLVGSAAPSTLGPQPQTFQTPPDPSFQQKQAADSLIQVIQKLSKIVEKRPQRFRTLAGQKRLLCEASARVPAGSGYRKTRKTCKDNESFANVGSGDGDVCVSASGDGNNNDIAAAVMEISDNPAELRRTVTCYQCSLCPYLSPTLNLLREHLKQHDENHSDLILMCSECRFTSRDQDQLEAHVKLHLDNNNAAGALKSEDSDKLAQKKWYSYEEYGLYRCLICSYVCSQQRMLKTHAWKHAGLVDCTYPIFEDEEGAGAKREAQIAPVTANISAAREEVVLLSPVLQDKSAQNVQSGGLKLQFCLPLAVESKPDVSTQTEAKIVKLEQEMEEENVYPMKDVVADGPVVEVQATTDAESHDNASDSLLSSAQKIINSSPNSAGHINVIVERLPSAGAEVLTTNPLLLSPDDNGDKSVLCKPEAVKVKDEYDDTGAVVESSIAESTASTGADLPRDENVPPTGRTRTHSESLRLHSLAAEVLVAMPMRTSESKPAEKAADGKTGAVITRLEQSLGALGEGDEEVPGIKAAGISLSLLTVIERLRERSDQNASDDDILKELQDNAQVQNGAAGGAEAGTGAAGHAEGSAAAGHAEGSAAASPDSGLVDYIQGSDRPYRCKLCQYTSGNKGYIKQHLRVHKQRRPYQCPICEHIATDSKDLESHMINHCKTKMYQCKQCPESFHYKCQLRTHDREFHSADEASVTDKATKGEEAYRVTDGEPNGQKVYKCDECEYTSATYLGVRNHRRIHNSDRPYRCCSCDFATTNMNSLKSHMRRHPQEHQAVQLLEQYRCSLCGYVCSHPPSLKSHMWKHAGDQNYNYEQVNKAINEAISQSSRAPQKSSPAQESAPDRPGRGPAEQPPSHSPTTDPSDAPADQSQGAPDSPVPPGDDQQQPQATEYCLLLFCCCICGFESTNKERLMEHMKEHEGDLISIILNKDQQQHGSLQIAE